MKVVIVEDEIRIREGISHLLEKMEEAYEIVGEAEDGQKGLELIRILKPEIVITDIRMPVMDGLVMLEKLHEEGIEVKTLVLSAYSEFEYARQAMKLGVTEYLLKPIMLDDFKRALSSIKKQLEKECLQQLEKMGSLEQIFSGLIWTGLHPDEALIEYMKKKYNIANETELIQVCIYLGNGFESQRKRAKTGLELLLSQNQEIAWCILEDSVEKSLLIVIYRYEDGHTLERWFQYQILKDSIHMDFHAGVGWIKTKGYETLKQGFDILYPYMDWNIILGEEVIISYPKITHVQTDACIYPVDLENRMKVSVCSGSTAKIRENMKQFHEYFQSGKVYMPKEIKECCVRFLWSFINTAKEVGCFDNQNLEQQQLLEDIMTAKNRRELEQITNAILSRIKREEKGDEEVMHLTVKRAKSMIQEFYQSGITLDEIAAKLNITPEYLGTQFHKQVGVNFSTYIRDFRMNKAKELLIGTSLKLYEIAEKVGYADAKYFSRVFKDCVGQLPADYRKSHK